MLKLALMGFSLFLVPIIVKVVAGASAHAFTWRDAILTGLAMAAVGTTSRLIGQAARRHT